MARIDQLISFCKVVDMNSFSIAAEALGLSQPTISLQIKSLEEEYGVKLLHRDGHKILPTEDGQFVYNHFIEMIALFERSKHGIRKNQNNYKGSLQIGASSGPGEYPIPIVLARFQKEHPDARVILHVGDSNEIMDKVANQSLEVGFVGTKRRDGNLTFSPYLEDTLILVAAKNYSFVRGGSITYEELQKIPLIILKKALSEVHLRLTDLNIILQMGLQDSVKAAVLAGYGATIISTLGVIKEIETGQLQKISTEVLDLRRQIHICHNREVPLTNLARNFIKYAIKYKKI
jgi:DNA-binding transcriptional LysR family regulator